MIHNHDCYSMYGSGAKCTCQEAEQPSNGGDTILIQAHDPEPTTNLSIVAGRGAAGGIDGSIIFHTNGKEVLRFNPDGTCYVREELVDNNRPAWEAVAKWFGFTSFGGGREIEELRKENAALRRIIIEGYKDR